MTTQLKPPASLGPVQEYTKENPPQVGDICLVGVTCLSDLAHEDQDPDDWVEAKVEACASSAGIFRCSFGQRFRIYYLPHHQRWGTQNWKPWLLRPAWQSITPTPAHVYLHEIQVQLGIASSGWQDVPAQELDRLLGQGESWVRRNLLAWPHGKKLVCDQSISDTGLLQLRWRWED